MSNRLPAPGRGGIAAARPRARDAALRRTRLVIGGVAAGAVGLSGLLSVVAAHAFGGHQQGSPTTTTQSRTPRIHVPGPQAIPSIAGDHAPLQPPASAPQPAAPAPAPAPQVSGGS